MNVASEIVLVAALAENNVIGKKNDLIWRLPDDLKHFVALTKGNNVLMGRKTYDSLFIKPLPKRKNLVISRNKALEYNHPDVLVFDEIEKTLEHEIVAGKPLFVIGGGEIYKQSLAIAHRLEITHVHAAFDGDTFFPEIELSQWKIVKEEFHPKDEKHEFAFTFTTYKRIKG